jgi:hypothetical protein
MPPWREAFHSSVKTNVQISANCLTAFTKLRIDCSEAFPFCCQSNAVHLPQNLISLPNSRRFRARFACVAMVRMSQAENAGFILLVTCLRIRSSHLFMKTILALSNVKPPSACDNAGCDFSSVLIYHNPIGLDFRYAHLCAGLSGTSSLDFSVQEPYRVPFSLYTFMCGF